MNTIVKPIDEITECGGKIVGTSTVYHVEMTPELAEKWLERRYEKQRKISKSKVNNYLHDMERGNWNESVIDGVVQFTDKGWMTNGQHRVCAVSEYGKPIVLPVIFNAREEDYEYIDNGMVRRVADYVVDGNAKTTASIARTLYNAENIPLDTIVRPMGAAHSNTTRVDITDYYNTHREIIRECTLVAMRMRSAIGTGSQTMFGYFYWLQKKIGNDSVLDDFVDSFCSEYANDPGIDALKIFLLRNTTKGIRFAGAVEYTERLFGALLVGYDNYINMTPMKKLNVTKKTLKKYLDRLNAVLEEEKKA